MVKIGSVGKFLEIFFNKLKNFFWFASKIFFIKNISVLQCCQIYHVGKIITFLIIFLNWLWGYKSLYASKYSHTPFWGFLKVVGIYNNLWKKSKWRFFSLKKKICRNLATLSIDKYGSCDDFKRTKCLELSHPSINFLGLVYLNSFFSNLWKSIGCNVAFSIIFQSASNLRLKFIRTLPNFSVQMT